MRSLINGCINLLNYVLAIYTQNVRYIYNVVIFYVCMCMEDPCIFSCWVTYYLFVSDIATAAKQFSACKSLMRASYEKEKLARKTLMSH